MGYIYCLTFPNGKKYVGQTTRTVEKRIQKHKAPGNPCRLVAKAYEKYGSFDVETLIEVNNNELNYYEMYYIQHYDTLVPNGYNLTTGGEGGIPSEATKDRMREAHSRRVVHDQWRQAISNGLKGHKHSDETKEKIRQARLENPTTPSEENRRKINERIRTQEVREKGSKSRRKDNADIPMYIQTIRKASNPGYCVSLPGQSQKHFTSTKLTMEEKLKLAIEYKAQQTSNKIT